jgi:sirohydrochlorin cobaltochelatase
VKATAVILFSHGSLLCGAGEALALHAARLRERGIARIVEVGYLNYSEPAFAATVDRCVAAGARRIVVAPYFLVPGYFVSAALPACIARARDTHPQVELVTAAPIGYDERLADALRASAQAAVGPANWGDDLAEAVRCCRREPECPPGGRPRCLAGAADEAATALERPLEVDAGQPAGPWDGKRALLVMVHGSPNPDANADVLRVVERVRESSEFAMVEPAFMECNTPTIPEAIRTCVAASSSTVVAVPYFLHTGAHVALDLPGLLEEARRVYPGVEFLLGPYLGRSPVLTDILADRISAVV